MNGGNEKRISHYSDKVLESHHDGWMTSDDRNGRHIRCKWNILRKVIRKKAKLVPQSFLKFSDSSEKKCVLLCLDTHYLRLYFFAGSVSELCF